MPGNNTDDNDTCAGNSPVIRCVDIDYAICVRQLAQYRFRDPLLFEVLEESDGVVLANENANLFGSGHTVEDALKDLAAEIDFSWNEYALEKDISKLHTSAQRYCGWLLQNIEVLSS